MDDDNQLTLNFADYPKSITELRQDQDTDGGCVWTPRDALIDMLREIDSGRVDVSDIMIIKYARKTPSDAYGVGYYAAGPNGRTLTAGMLAKAMQLLLED